MAVAPLSKILEHIVTAPVNLKLDTSESSAGIPVILGLDNMGRSKLPGSKPELLGFCSKANLSLFSCVRNTSGRIIIAILCCTEWRPKFNLEITKEFDTFRQALHHLQEGVAFGTVGGRMDSGDNQAD